MEKGVDLFSTVPEDGTETNGQKLYKERSKFKIRKNHLNVRAIKQ